MDIEFSEFIKKVKKVDQPRNHKVKNSIGTKSAYEYYRRNKPKEKEFVLSYNDYSSIVNEMNTLWVDKLLSKGELLLPEGLGHIKISKLETRVTIDSNGRLRTTRPVDMASTLKLWYEDKDAYENKVKLRFDDEYRFKITHSTRKSKFKNCTYFKFQPNRNLKQKMRRLIESGNFDTFEIKNTQ